MPFSYESQNVRIIKDDNGLPWWVVKDVCEVLGLENINRAVSKLDPDDCVVKKINDISGRSQEMYLMNEPGLYTFIIRSNKPEAKKFKKWITNDVLPSIRKNGYYEIPEEKAINETVISRPQLAEIAFRVKQTMKMVRAFGFNGDIGRMMTNKVVEKSTGIDVLDLLEVKDFVENSINPDKDYRLPPPKRIKYKRFTRSVLADFVEEKCFLHVDAKTSASDLYNEFCSWFPKKYKVRELPSQKRFGTMVADHFERSKSGTYSYIGIGLVKNIKEVENVN